MEEEEVGKSGSLGLNVLYDDEGNSYPIDDARAVVCAFGLRADYCQVC